MTHAEFVNAVSGLDKDRKMAFYIHLARNLTISVRSIWSDESLSVDERLERLKWMNEAMHRVINRLSDVYHDHNIWTDDAMWRILRDTVVQHPGMNGDVGGAVRATLDQMKDKGFTSIE